MGDDEYEVYDDGEGEHDTEFLTQSTLAPRKGNKWLLLASTLQLAEGIAREVSDYFNLLKTGAFGRYSWQAERQEFFEEASKSLERLTAVENAEVQDATGE